MKKSLLATLALFAPAVLTAPRPARVAIPGGSRPTIASIVDDCQATGLAGWALVDEATRRVHEAFDHHSMWHLWESPAQAVQHGRGWSAQYNQALAQVLRELGFLVTVVHAARVRGLGRNPWWQAGHTWLQVTHEGRTLDVCAGTAGNTAGVVPFVAMSEVRPVHPWTRASVSAALAPVVAVQVWRQVLGQPTARWLYRDFDQPL